MKSRSLCLMIPMLWISLPAWGQIPSPPPPSPRLDIPPAPEALPPAVRSEGHPSASVIPGPFPPSGPSGSPMRMPAPFGHPSAGVVSDPFPLSGPSGWPMPAPWGHPSVPYQFDPTSGRPALMRGEVAFPAAAVPSVPAHSPAALLRPAPGVLGPAPVGGLHLRYPYYSYRRPWYTPGPASQNVTIIW